MSDLDMPVRFEDVLRGNGRIVIFKIMDRQGYGADFTTYCALTCVVTFFV
jgi:hypothetical protein